MSSPPQSHPSTRPRVTYGRRKVDSAPTPDNDARAEAHSHPPRTSSLQQSVDGQDDASAGDDIGSSAYSWKRQLEAIDNTSDDESPRSVNKLPRTLSEQCDEQSHRSRPEEQVEAEAACIVPDYDSSFSGSLPALTASSSQLSNLSHPSPPPSNLSRQPGTPHRRGVAASRETSPVTSPPVPPITTPNGRSSPTPPTSDDDMPTKPLLKGNGKNKPKGQGHALAPLEMRGAPRESSRRKDKKTDKQRKPKAPTKNERDKSRLESARMLSDAPATIPRESKIIEPLSFFSKLNASVNAAERRTDSALLSSDHDSIQAFSSSPSFERIPQPSRSASPLRETSLLRNKGHEYERADPFHPPPSSPPLFPPAADSDSDSEAMPSMAVILKQGDAVRDAARRKAELAEKKRAVVEQRKREAETRIYKGGDKGGVDSDSDDDDGLLVVQDNMQVVAREEAAERTRRTAPTEGKRRQLEYALGHSKAITAIASPAKRSTLSKSPKKLMEVAGRPTFAREGLGMAMSKKEVNQMLWQSKESVDEHLRREKEEEWLKGGGQVSGYMDIVEGGGKDLLEQALKRRAEAAEEGAFEGEDDEDEDWQPERGSASPEAEPHDGNAGQQREEEDEVSRSEDASMDDEEDAENENLIRRARHRPLFRTGVVDSDAESDAPVPGPSSHPPPPSYVSPSFELSPSPLFKDAEPDFEFGNETDKENATGRKFDMGEDKENKAVARHGPLGRGLAFTPDSGEEPADSQPLSSLKSPLIPRADDPFALMRSPPREKQEALAHLQSPLPSMPLALALPEKDRKGGFSQFSDDDVGTTFTQSDSLGLMPAPFAGGGKVGKGLSQAFEQTQNDMGFNDLRQANASELSLTFDANALQPAIEVDNHLLEKADQIFEKEQEYVLEAARPTAEKQHKAQVYINDNGFLTQTRPDVQSPEIYKPSPSQPTNFASFLKTRAVGDSPFSPSLREPFRTLASSESDRTPSVRTHRRIMRKSPSIPGRLTGYNSSPSPSPSPKKVNAFDVLHEGTKKRKERNDIGLKFVEDQAVESDEEDSFGFGAARGRNGEDDEEENEEDAKDLEELMDDEEMSEEAVARAAVLEKHKEHQDEDDAEAEKIARDAVEGKLRSKRRDRGVGLGDSESEDDDDDDAAKRKRQRMAKRRKIVDDNLEDLAKNPATLAFYETYRQELEDDGRDFAHLQQDEAMSVASDGDGDNDADPQEVVSNTEIRRQLLDVAQGKQEYQRLDLDDVTWLDAPDSGDEGPLRIREVDSGPGKGRMPQQEALDVVMPRKRKGGIDKQLKERMEHWAKEEGSLRHTGGTGRGGAGASVTGLSKAKPVGAVKDGRAQPSRAGSGGQRQDTRKPVRKTASVLSAVSDRRARFEGHN